MTTDDLVKINKDYFTKLSQAAAKTAVFTAIPYLNIPPINFIISKLIDWIVSKIADGLEIATFFIYVDLRVNTQGRDYVLAANEAEKLQTEESRKKADEAFKKFAHFNSL